MRTNFVNALLGAALFAVIAIIRNTPACSREVSSDSYQSYSSIPKVEIPQVDAENFYHSLPINKDSITKELIPKFDNIEIDLPKACDMPNTISFDNSKFAPSKTTLQLEKKRDSIMKSVRESNTLNLECLNPKVEITSKSDLSLSDIKLPSVNDTIARKNKKALGQKTLPTSTPISKIKTQEINTNTPKIVTTTPKTFPKGTKDSLSTNQPQ